MDARSLESTLDLVLETHPDGILVLDEARVVRFANPAAAELLDSSVEALLGRQYNGTVGAQLELKSPQDRILRMRTVATVWRGQAATLLCVTDVTEPPALPRSDGPRLDRKGLHDLVNALNTVRLAADGVMDQAEDTRVDLVQEVADRLYDHADTLAPMLAVHDELRGFPTRLSSVAERVRRQHERLMRETEQLQASLDQFTELIGSLREDAALGARCALVDVVDRALALEAPALSRLGVEVDVALGEAGEEPVETRPVLSILRNLLSNARNAVQAVDGRRPAIAITARMRTGKRLRVVVSDNGEGIARDDLERVFRRGYSGRENGHGLGLYQCARTARQLGGRLTAHSDGPDSGATFLLELPCQRDKADPTDTPLPAEARNRRPQDSLESILTE